MKFNLKERRRMIKDDEEIQALEKREIIAGYEEWFEGFEEELQESLAYHDKMIDHWENKVSESHPLYRYRERIAGECRVARGILTAVLGVEPRVKEEK